MNKKYVVNFVIILVSWSLLFFIGCEESSDDVSAEDSTAAVAKVNEAIAALEAEIEEIVNAEPDSVQAVLDLLDFSGPYALFVEANELDHRNNDANFGLGFTGFLMLSQDDQLQEMLLRWESYFNIHEPFTVTDPQPSLMKSGYGLPLTVDGIRVPIAPLIEMPFALSKMSVDDVPQFSEFQDLVESLFLPVVLESIAALELVDDDPDYVFEISAAMQGEDEAEPIELDLTEIYVLEMGLYGLKGLLKTVIAYDLDFASFDSAGIVDELSQGSNFATLKAGGADDLASALTSALLAADRAVSALDFLEAETDLQDDDLIRNDEDVDLDEIRQVIEEVQSALSGPTIIHYEYWDDMNEDDNKTDDEMIEDSVNVNISQFFNNPINDFKAMLPPYTIGIMHEYEYEYDSITADILVEDSNVIAPDLDETLIELTLSYQNQGSEPEFSAFVTMYTGGGLGVAYHLSNPANQDVLPEGVYEMYAEFLALVQFYSSELYQFQSIEFSWLGVVTTGESLTIQGSFVIEYEERVKTYTIPDPQWNAGTYSEWLNAWPDPTMNAIFPDLDAAGLANLLDFNEENWDDFNN
mgnify:CR=1 FL=1